MTLKTAVERSYPLYSSWPLAYIIVFFDIGRMPILCLLSSIMANTTQDIILMIYF